MKFLLKLLLVAVIGLPLAALATVWLCFQPAPLVVNKAEISVADIENAKRLLHKHDTRNAKEGRLRAIVASQHDVDLILNYAASQYRKASTRVVLRAGTALVQASMEVPWIAFAPWLNVDAQLRETGGIPTFERLRIGSLPLPGFIADFALSRLVAHFNSTDEGKLATDVVKRVTLLDAQVQVLYEWRDDTPDRLRAAMIPRADQDRMKAYSDRLVEITAKAGSVQSISLAQLMSPMFALAKQRTVTGDATTENRAAIVTLAFYSIGRGLSAIIPAAKDWPAPRALRVTLNGRDDFPQHFLVSAAIAAEAGSPLADAIGLYKEVEDSRGGSGFSFNDIAADRAGTRFGELAVKAPQKLQTTLAAGVHELDFMPDVSDLPEFMQEAEFKKRYGGISAPGYNKMMANIEARVASRPLFR